MSSDPSKDSSGSAPVQSLPTQIARLFIASQESVAEAAHIESSVIALDLPRPALETVFTFHFKRSLAEVQDTDKQPFLSYCRVASYSNDLRIMLFSFPVTKSVRGKVT